ncbi:hypothetical protein HPB47_021486 [Ixodes persulcatus]|uniref:Uncharacterized protein n=1 Tax=Ixodes persulcatus TaxID=34615 RepID=A0AC60QCF1_IXOPE|nr:hypothetical protein HPB47_021486 [Ixodes persulcatus]
MDEQYTHGTKVSEDHKQFAAKKSRSTNVQGILALQICDRALYGSVVELQGFVSIEEAQAKKRYRSERNALSGLSTHARSWSEEEEETLLVFRDLVLGVVEAQRAVATARAREVVRTWVDSSGSRNICSQR